MLTVLVREAAAAGLVFPSVIERMTGARVDLAPVKASLGLDAVHVRVECADTELYGIGGLRSNGLRASGARGVLFVTASVAGTDAPVGSETRAVLETGWVVRHLWQGAVRAGAERLSLAGNAPFTRRLAGVASRVDAGCITTVADVEVLEADGPGYETSVSLAARLRAGMAQVIGTVRIDGDRFMGAGIAVVARLCPNLALIAGYDDGSGSVRGGVVIDWRGLEVAAGVFLHPVLGMSQGVSVACAR